MKQAVQNLRSGEVHVVEVPPPRLRPGGALVATRTSLISAGTERSKIEMGRKSLVGKARAKPELAQQVVKKARQDGLRETYATVMQRLEAPTPLGYSACGEVVAVAPDVVGVKPGDLVACAGAGYANHAQVNFVPMHLIAAVPEGIGADQAAYGTLGAIAMQGVRQAEIGLGDRVAVIGLGLVGLISVQLARAAGARVLGIDLDPAACALARTLGAEQVVERGAGVAATATAFSEGIGVDAVLVCAATASADPIELGAEILRDRGRVVLVGHVGLSLPRDPFYYKELDLRFSRSYGPGRYDPAYEERGQDYPVGYVRWTEQRNLSEFLRLVRDGFVAVDPLTSHRFPIDEAAAAYGLIAGDHEHAERPIGVLLDYPDSVSAAGTGRVHVSEPTAHAASDRIRLAMVGAGNFATRVLLPAVMGDERIAAAGISTAGGASARQVAERFGFAYATSDAEALIDDPDVDAVIIATRHDTHAPLAARALGAGKAVFCEKPLALDWAGLEFVATSYAARPIPFLVGFNRRFSPFTRRLRASLPAGVPRMIIIRVNAGPLPADHWMRDPVAGGGRVVGEACHFLDLACHLAGARPARVAAESLGSDESLALNDSVAITVAFADGSVASIQYLANGDTAVAKERIEVFCGGMVGLIDDFRRLELTRGGKTTTHRLRRQEKGHREEMRSFVHVAAGGLSEILPVEDIFWSSALTLQVPASLGGGRAMAVELPEALGGRGATAGEAVGTPAD